MAYLKLHDVYGDASVLVIVDGSEATFGALEAPFSEVSYTPPGDPTPPIESIKGSDLQPWHLWEWDGAAPAPVTVDDARMIARGVAGNRLVIHRWRPEWHKHDGTDFKKVGLHLDEVSVAGEVQTRTWYASATVPTLGAPAFSTPVVKHTYTWQREDGYPKICTTDVEMYLEDGTIDAAQDHSYTESFQDQATIKEGKRRRGRLIDKMSSTLVAMIQVTESMTLAAATAEGRTFAETHETEIGRLKKYNDHAIETAIAGDATSWLDNLVDVAPFNLPAGTKIRDYLTTEIQGAT